MSSSSTTVDAEIERAWRKYPICFCKLRPKVDRSRTAENPGRRFLHCPLQQYQCKFFKWVDEWRPPQVEHSNREVERESFNMLMNMFEREVKKNDSNSEKIEILELEVSDLKFALKELENKQWMIQLVVIGVVLTCVALILA